MRSGRSDSIFSNSRFCGNWLSSILPLAASCAALIWSLYELVPSATEAGCSAVLRVVQCKAQRPSSLKSQLRPGNPYRPGSTQLVSSRAINCFPAGCTGACTWGRGSTPGCSRPGFGGTGWIHQPTGPTRCVAARHDDLSQDRQHPGGASSHPSPVPGKLRLSELAQLGETTVRGPGAARPAGPWTTRCVTHRQVEKRSQLQFEPFRYPQMHQSDRGASRP